MQKLPLQIALKRALTLIGERQRLVFLMFEMEGLKHSEIAAILQVPEGTSRSWLFEAKSQLKRLLMEKPSMKFECGDLERALAVSDLMPEAKEHLRSCPVCRGEYRLWQDISSAGRDLHEEWESPNRYGLAIRQALEGGA